MSRAGSSDGLGGSRSTGSSSGARSRSPEDGSINSINTTVSDTRPNVTIDLNAESVGMTFALLGVIIELMKSNPKVTFSIILIIGIIICVTGLILFTYSELIAYICLVIGSVLVCWSVYMRNKNERDNNNE